MEWVTEEEVKVQVFVGIIAAIPSMLLIVEELMNIAVSLGEPVI